MPLEQSDMDFIAKLFHSLESEMRKEFAAVRGEVKQRFDTLESRVTQMSDRMDRVGGLINGGSRAIAKMIEWTERTDVTLGDVLRRQAGFEERLRKLEGANGESK